jgi:hypothetical protein
MLTRPIQTLINPNANTDPNSSTRHQWIQEAKHTYNYSKQNKKGRFEVFTAVSMINCVFWDVTPYGSCKNPRFGRTERLLHQGDKN